MLTFNSSTYMVTRDLLQHSKNRCVFPYQIKTKTRDVRHIFCPASLSFCVHANNNHLGFFIILSCTYFSIPFFDALVITFQFFIALLYYVFSLCGKHTFYALNMRGINFVFTNQKASLIIVSSYMIKTLHIIFWYYLLIRKFIINAIPVFLIILSTSCVYPVAVSMVIHSDYLRYI